MVEHGIVQQTKIVVYPKKLLSAILSKKIEEVRYYPKNGKFGLIKRNDLGAVLFFKKLLAVLSKKKRRAVLSKNNKK